MQNLFDDETDDENFVERYIISNMPIILLVFANLGIIAADYRAYDVLLTLLGKPWKAALAVAFSCAIPFVLWEMAWQYKYATTNWRRVSLGMAFLAFATSIVYGIADFVLVDGQTVNPVLLTSGAVVLTGVHILFGILFFYNDPRIAMKRLQTQQIAKVQNANDAAILANALLANAQTVGKNLQTLYDLYGKEQADILISQLQGKKPAKKMQTVDTNPTTGDGSSL